MNMHRTCWAMAAALAVCVSQPLSADTGISSEILVQSSTSWDGAAFNYPEGMPEISVVRIRIPAGGALPWHCHPVPLAGVVTRGRLVVTKRDGESITVEEGEGLIEVSRQWHRGFAEEEAEIVVVYAGAEGIPTGFGEQAEPDLAGLCR